MEYLTKETAKAYENRMRVLQDMVKTEGWQHFCLMVEATAAQALGAAVNSKDPHGMATSIAVYKTLVDIQGWPEREIKSTFEALNQA